MDYIDHNLDFPTLKNKHFKRAKITFGFLCLAFVLSILFTVFTGRIQVEDDLKDLLIGIPIFITLLLCPFALYFIVKSYICKEEVTKYRLLYLCGILLFNVFFLVLIVVLVNDFNGI